MSGRPTDDAGATPGGRGGRDELAGDCDLLDAYWDALERGDSTDPDGWLRDRAGPGAATGLSAELATLKLLHRHRDQLDMPADERPASTEGTPAPGPDPTDHYEPDRASSLSPDAAWLATQQVYLIGPLDKGGMGAVFLAWHGGLKREVIVKVARDPALDARFRREIAIHARLGGHPHIAVVRTAGEREGRPYLVLDHVVGVDLRKLVADRGPLPYREACDYAVQAARGLGHAHERGVVHRDVKPANLVLSHEDRAVRVIDWGLAKDGGRDGRGDEDLTRSGVALGTFSYAAPEQLINPAAVSPRSDLYSLGCTLHEMLTGRPPFAGRPDLIRAHACDPVPPLPPELGVPSPVEGVVRKLLAKLPEDRFASAADFIAAVARVEPEIDSPPANLRPGWRVAVLVLLVAGIALWAARLRPDLDRPVTALGSAQGPSPSLIRVVSLSIDLEPETDKEASRQRLPGRIGAQCFSTKVGDDVQVKAELSEPAYAYLLALPPNGDAVLCDPDNKSAPPARSVSLSYPPPKVNLRYRLEEGTGLFAFAVVVSRTPLPSFQDWLRKNGPPPRRTGPPAAGVVWRYDGHNVTFSAADDQAGQRGLGHPPRGGKADFIELVRWLHWLPDIDAVKLEAFPVEPASGP